MTSLNPYRNEPDEQRPGGGPNAARPADRNLARLLAPIRAASETVNDVHRLRLEPVTAAEIVEFWCLINPVPAARTLLCRREVEGAPSLASIAESTGASGVEVLGPDRIVVDDRAFTRIMREGGIDDVLAIRIEGPIEALDAQVIEQADHDGESALTVELRASASMQFSRDSVELHTYAEEAGWALVADRLRRYIASVLQVSPDPIASPDVPLIQALLRNGTLSVRPIETEVFSTAIDVGINVDGGTGAATEALIYDLYANTWHGE